MSDKQLTTEDVRKTNKQIPVRYRIWPVFEGVAAMVGIFFIFLFVSFFIYEHALNAQKGEIQDGLLHTAAVISTMIDGDVHHTFTNKGQETSAEYLEFIKPLEKVLAKDKDIAYIYTLRLVDGKVYFVVDPTPPGDSDGDGVDDKSHIMELYEDATPAMFRALSNQVAAVEKEPSRDKWGAFISGYVPFYDSNDEFAGVVGIDLTANNYFTRLEPIKRATIRTFATAFFISWMIGAVVWFMRKFAKVLNQKRNELLKTTGGQP